MSRSGYCDDLTNWSHICWRGAVASAIRGKRGQAFLKELLAALDALPEKRLIAWELQQKDQVCALGAVGKSRGLDMEDLDPEDHEKVAKAFDIPHALACEIMWENDEARYWEQTPEQRFKYVRDWVVRHIRSDGDSTR